MPSSKNFFTPEEQNQLINAIKEAELNTSGEIRLHLEDKCKGDAVERATQIFGKLKMHETELHNGILFYLAVQTHDFAVVGDSGIHAKVGQDFWDIIKDKAIDRFKKNEFAKGLEEAILECGSQLKKYFPLQANDKNELSDEISFS